MTRTFGVPFGYAQAVRRTTKLLPMVVLAILIVANVVLLLLLFRPDGAIEAQPGGGAATLSPAEPTWSLSDSPSASTGPTSSAESNPSAESTPSAQSAEPVPPQQLIFAASAKTAWRATVGDCGTPGKLERSTDGGTSWKLVVKTGLAPIVRLGQTGNDLYTIGGRGSDCSTRYVAYSADGKVTASTNRPVDIWFLSPDDRDEVNAPGDTKTRPCKDHVIGLTHLDSSRALVVCTDGSALSTSNAGKAWRQITRLPGTLAVGSGDGRYWLAGTTADCEGITVRWLTVDGSDASQGATQCAPATEVAPGHVAVDASGDAVWVWTGSRVQVSTDRGRSWP